MPKIARAFARTKNQFNLWMELMTAIDSCPEVVPCTNFPDLFFPESANGHALKDIFLPHTAQVRTLRARSR
jgi:hypothetical protein